MVDTNLPSTDYERRFSIFLIEAEGMAILKTRKCHPKLKETSHCLAPDDLELVGKGLGAPEPLVKKKGKLLRKWLTRKTHCKSERCLVEKSHLDPKRKAQIIKSQFRPTMPDSWIADPDQWLDSNNISDVMKQYEESNPEFKFLGTNPIDFAAPDPYTKGAAQQGKCIEDAICKLSLAILEREGKTKIGVVYNLDPSNKGGSHWIASYTDITGHRTYYFDSYGMRPPNQIARFMRSLTLQDPKMKLEYNSRRHQFGNSECGMYCLYFLIQMINGESFKKFCRRAKKDFKMLELRQELFASKL